MACYRMERDKKWLNESIQLEQDKWDKMRKDWLDVEAQKDTGNMEETHCGKCLKFCCLCWKGVRGIWCIVAGVSTWALVLGILMLCFTWGKADEPRVMLVANPPVFSSVEDYEETPLSCESPSPLLRCETPGVFPDKIEAPHVNVTKDWDTNTHVIMATFEQLRNKWISQTCTRDKAWCHEAKCKFNTSIEYQFNKTAATNVTDEDIVECQINVTKVTFDGYLRKVLWKTSIYIGDLKNISEKACERENCSWAPKWCLEGRGSFVGCEDYTKVLLGEDMVKICVRNPYAFVRCQKEQEGRCIGVEVSACTPPIPVMIGESYFIPNMYANRNIIAEDVNAKAYYSNVSYSSTSKRYRAPENVTINCQRFIFRQAFDTIKRVTHIAARTQCNLTGVDWGNVTKEGNTSGLWTYHMKNAENRLDFVCRSNDTEDGRAVPVYFICRRNKTTGFKWMSCKALPGLPVPGLGWVRTRSWEPNPKKPEPVSFACMVKAPLVRCSSNNSRFMDIINNQTELGNTTCLIEGVNWPDLVKDLLYGYALVRQPPFMIIPYNGSMTKQLGFSRQKRVAGVTAVAIVALLGTLIAGFLSAVNTFSLNYLWKLADEQAVLNTQLAEAIADLHHGQEQLAFGLSILEARVAALESQMEVLSRFALMDCHLRAEGACVTRIPWSAVFNDTPAANVSRMAWRQWWDTYKRSHLSREQKILNLTVAAKDYSLTAEKYHKDAEKWHNLNSWTEWFKNWSLSGLAKWILGGIGLLILFQILLSLVMRMVKMRPIARGYRVIVGEGDDGEESISTPDINIATDGWSELEDSNLEFNSWGESPETETGKQRRRRKIRETYQSTSRWMASLPHWLQLVWSETPRVQMVNLVASKRKKKEWTEGANIC